MYRRRNPQDLNLPITGVAALFIVLFLKLPIPPGTFRDKLSRMDWMYVLRRLLDFRVLTSVSSGNVMIIASSTACVIALSWGGVRYPWASARVVAPLVLGVCGLCAALLYEARFAKEPLVSYPLLSVYPQSLTCSILSRFRSVCSPTAQASAGMHNVLVPIVYAHFQGSYIQTFIGPMMTMSILCTSLAKLDLPPLVLNHLMNALQISERHTSRHAKAHHPDTQGSTSSHVPRQSGPFYCSRDSGSRTPRRTECNYGRAGHASPQLWPACRPYMQIHQWAYRSGSLSSRALAAASCSHPRTTPCSRPSPLPRTRTPWRSLRFVDLSLVYVLPSPPS